MTVNKSTVENGKRRRKTHRKSTHGCSNCKLRHVKCDETQPRCKKCTSFGVSCNYDPTANDLELAVNGMFVFEAPVSRLSMTRTILGVINNPPCIQSSRSEVASEKFEVDDEDFEIVSRFQSSTILTIGAKGTAHIYQQKWFPVACEHSMLMHVMLAMTLMHDRYRSGFATARASVKETFHYYEATKMFNRKLSNYENSDRDALWATAALLGCMSFANIEARRYEEAWPLKAPSESDLHWLRMSEGKKAVWKIADPMREDSIIREVWDNYALDAVKDVTDPALRHCPTFIELYGLEDDISEETPYSKAIFLLMPLLEIECNHSTIAKFLSFIGWTSPEYRKLLDEKDPLALLLMAYWYAKMIPYQQWWISPRVTLECQAICVYLKRFHSHNKGIQSLLHFPSTTAGLDLGQI